MERIKKFWIWLVIFVLFYLFVDFICFASVKMMYKDLNEYEILVNSPKIEILEAKGTYANGYIKGILTNNTNSMITNKYIKVDVYSERNVNMGTEYIEIAKLDLAKRMSFEVKYTYTDVSSYKIDIVDEKPDEATIEPIRLEPEVKVAILVGGLLAIWAAPFIP